MFGLHNQEGTILYVNREKLTIIIWSKLCFTVTTRFNQLFIFLQRRYFSEGHCHSESMNRIGFKIWPKLLCQSYSGKRVISPTCLILQKLSSYSEGALPFVQLPWLVHILLYVAECLAENDLHFFAVWFSIHFIFLCKLSINSRHPNHANMIGIEVKMIG